MNLKKTRQSNFKKFLPLTILALPGLVYLFINNYIPMAGLFIAFKSINFQLGFFKSPWVGLENFRYLFATPDAFIITRNTILYNVGFIILNTATAVTVAILLDSVKNKFLKRTYQTFYLLPMLISMVVISYIVFAFLSINNGFMNKTLLPILGIEKQNWYNTPKFWPYILNIVNIWKNFGFMSIVYFASIIGINPQLFEAGRLDGATKMQEIRFITLPLIRQTIIMLVIMSMGRIFFSDFGLFFQVPMNSGSLFSTTNVIDTYVYRGLMLLGDIGMSSAAGFYQSTVGFVVVLLANLVVSKIDPDSALF